MTKCNESQFEFEEHISRRVVAQFSGERLTAESGALLKKNASYQNKLRIPRSRRSARKNNSLVNQARHSG